MRRVRYQVAASLDGYIADPNGEAGWIPMDPDIDFEALFAQFDTVLMGRRTFEVLAREGRTSMPGMRTVVASRTLTPAAHPSVTIIGDRVAEVVADLRRGEGRDIWLFGGGALFRTLLAANVVDTVEPAIVPILLGGGIPLLPPGAAARLTLTGHTVYAKSGIVLLQYAVEGAARSQPRLGARE